MNPTIILTRSPNVFSLGQVDIVEYTIRSNMSVPIYISCTIPKTVLPQKQADASPIPLDQNAWALTGPRHYHMKILLPETELVVSWQLCPLISGFVMLPPLLITWTTTSYADSSKSQNHSFQHLYSKLVHIWVDPFGNKSN